MLVQFNFPEPLIFTKEEAMSIKNINGIYLLYSKDDELLYIGKSEELKTRIKSHLKGVSNVYEYSGEFDKIKCFYISSLLDAELCETYLINTLNPKYNTRKRIVNRKKEIRKVKPKRYSQLKNPTYDRDILFEMRVTNGLTVQEIADKLNISITTVSKHLSYYKITVESKPELLKDFLINKMTSLKTGENFSIKEVIEAGFVSATIYQVLNEDEIQKVIQKEYIYKTGVFYFKSNQKLSCEEILKLKVCNKCREVLDVNDFQKIKTGFKGQCKQCRKSSQ
ncbi:TPA: GIY-YIG nuclease family protein [Bacillus wiedmannii]|nr:hypothetical protein A6284_26645 [Bacillus wiedmannii]HDR7640805.1 GIY-YIG nuclease family protein [Bacillus wiedmannii]